MKWYKHDTDANRSEGLSALKAEMGWAWLARWYVMLEMVADKMDKSDRCHLEYTESQWCRYLECRPSRLRTYLVCIESRCNSIVVRNGNLIRISVPNLLKKKDEYSSHVGTNSEPKSGESTNENKSKNKSIEKEEEKEKNKTKEKSKISGKVVPKSGYIDLEDIPPNLVNFVAAFNEIHNAYPRVPRLDTARPIQAKRLQRLEDRMKEPTWDTSKVLDSIQKVPWYNGTDPNLTGSWSFSFDWMLERQKNGTEANYVKMIQRLESFLEAENYDPDVAELEADIEKGRQYIAEKMGTLNGGQ